MIVGRLAFPFGMVRFQGRTVKLPGCRFCNSPKSTFRFLCKLQGTGKQHTGDGLGIVVVLKVPDEYIMSLDLFVLITWVSPKSLGRPACQV